MSDRPDTREPYQRLSDSLAEAQRQLEHAQADAKLHRDAYRRAVTASAWMHDDPAIKAGLLIGQSVLEKGLPLLRTELAALRETNRQTLELVTHWHALAEKRFKQLFEAEAKLRAFSAEMPPHPIMSKPEVLQHQPRPNQNL